MSQILPLLVYFGAQKLMAPELLGDPLSELLPQWLLSWLPAIAGVITFIVSSQMAQAGAAKETAALNGQEAPDFDFQEKDKEPTSLRKLIAETKLPTLVDFYQNFWPACGPAAQQIDKMAADPKYKGKVNFMLCNLKSIEDAEAYAKQKGLTGAAMHGTGSAPKEYGLKYIPHKVLIDGDGLVVKNFDVKLPADLDELLSG